MKLRYKLLLGFLFSAVLVAVVGYVSHSLNRNIRDRLIRVNSRSIYLMEYTGEMSMSLHKSLMYSREYLDEKRRLSKTQDTSGEKRKKIRFAARQAEKQVQDQLDQFKKFMDKSLSMARQIQQSSDTLQVAGKDTLYKETMVGQLQSFQEKFRIYESLLLELFKLSDNGTRDGQQLLTVTLEPFFKTTLMPLVDKIRSRAHLRVDKETAQLEEQLSFAVQTILFVSLLAFVSAMGLGYAIYRQISDPLNKLTESAQRIGEGKLDERIGINSEDEIGTLASTFNQMVENLDRTTVSRNYFNNIIESLSDALIVVDPSYKILKVNRALIDLTGYSETALVEKKLLTLFEEDEQSRIEEQIQSASPDTPEYIETRLTRQDREQVQVSFAASPLNEPQHQGGYVCLISDITERKKAEEKIEKSLEEKKVLLAEIHHRVKNNLAVISSLLQMQLHNTENETVRNLLQNSVLRIQSIALIHEKLYQTDTLAFIDYDTYLEDLINTIKESFEESEKDIGLDMDIVPVSLNVNQAIPVSLFINEVMVNAFKHAFTDRQEGEVYVKLDKLNGHLKLLISDDGIGLPEEFDPDEAETLGMTLIKTLTKQLAGDLSIYNDGGVVYELEFPIE